MLFIRPTVIRDRDEYRQASSGQYTAFNDAQSKQRGKENNDAMLSNDLLEIYPRQIPPRSAVSAPPSTPSIWEAIYDPRR